MERISTASRTSPAGSHAAEDRAEGHLEDLLATDEQRGLGVCRRRQGPLPVLHPRRPAGLPGLAVLDLPRRVEGRPGSQGADDSAAQT
ncbi:hypothetical protein BJF90_27150 [Pseudonocardia sp. CNS-004]|nr:hypothetical protein BJF90_27150 [Pseudonocardia sp. CNS-004]